MENNLLCEVCGREMTAEEAEYVNDTLLCADCMETETVLCRCCGERIFTTDAIDGDLCEQCADEHYTHCCSCGVLISNEDALYTEADEYDHDYPYCRQCYNKYCDDIIHSYYYKPDPVFYGSDSDLYLGIELEINEGGEDDEYAEMIYDTANMAEDRLYIKHDSSIDNGFELVSHPMTLYYHRKTMPWREILKKAVSLGYLSHQADCCGLHIHVNRAAFGLTRIQQEESIARLVFFYEKFWPEILRFSRRTEAQANRWASRYGGVLSTCKNSLDTAKKAVRGRYTAVNLKPENTIEFRIFRGTLRYETFIATLEFTHYLCELAKELSDENFHAMSWSEFVSGIDATEYPELVNYLKIRRLYVNEPVNETEEI